MSRKNGKRKLYGYMAISPVKFISININDHMVNFDIEHDKDKDGKDGLIFNEGQTASVPVYRYKKDAKKYHPESIIMPIYKEMTTRKGCLLEIPYYYLEK